MVMSRLFHGYIIIFHLEEKMSHWVKQSWWKRANLLWYIHSFNHHLNHQNKELQEGDHKQPYWVQSRDDTRIGTHPQTESILPQSSSDRQAEPRKSRNEIRGWRPLVGRDFVLIHTCRRSWKRGERSPYGMKAILLLLIISFPPTDTRNVWTGHQVKCRMLLIIVKWLWTYLNNHMMAHVFQRLTLFPVSQCSDQDLLHSSRTWGLNLIRISRGGPSTNRGIYYCVLSIFSWTGKHTSWTDCDLHERRGKKWRCHESSPFFWGQSLDSVIILWRTSQSCGWWTIKDVSSHRGHKTLLLNENNGLWCLRHELLLCPLSRLLLLVCSSSNNDVSFPEWWSLE